jgi:copper chaperone
VAIVLSIPRMKCDGCVAAIRQALAGINAIGDFKVDLASKTVTFEPARADLEEVKKALTKAGYPPAQ